MNPFTWPCLYWAMTSLACMILALVLLFFSVTVFREDGDRLKFKFKFVWYDAWMGAYYDEKRWTLYFCPAPMLCLSFRLVARGVEDDRL